MPPRLHDLVEVCRDPVAAPRFAIARLEVAGTGGVPLTGLTLTEARLYAAAAGARLPTEDEMKAKTVLHEIAHLTGALPLHVAPDSAPEFTLQMLQKCFGINPIPV